MKDLFLKQKFVNLSNKKTISFLKRQKDHNASAKYPSELFSTSFLRFNNIFIFISVCKQLMWIKTKKAINSDTRRNWKLSFKFLLIIIC